MADEVQSTPPTPSGYNKRPLWQWIVLYVIIAVIAYGLLYYFIFAKKGTYNQQATQYPSTTAQPSVASPSTASTATIQQFTVVGTEFSFTPSTLTVKKDIPVTITFKNNGTYPHNLTIVQLGLATKTIAPGQTDSITFTPAKAGTYSFMCTVPGHADKGMKGTLTVE